VSSILPKNELEIQISAQPTGAEFFCSFFEKIKKTKYPFEINRPLVCNL
jgi:hypothetical protein